MAKQCQPCVDNNKTTAADGVCRECEECMCRTCFKHHLVARVCRNHVLLPLDEHTFEIIGEKRVDICEKHERQPIRFYCRQHDQVGCGDCMIFEGHASCQPESINNAAKNIREQKGFKHIHSQVTILTDENQGNARKLQENKHQNTKMMTMLEESAKRFRAKVNSFLDHAESDFFTELQGVHQKHDGLLEKLKRDCNSAFTDLRECQKILDRKHHSEAELFIHSLVIKAKLLAINKTVKQTQSLNSIEQYEFQPEQNLKGVVLASKGLGSLIKVTDGENKNCKRATACGSSDVDNAKGPPPSMQIFVNVAGRHYILTVTPFENTKSLKKKIFDKTSIPVDQQILQVGFTGKRLRDELKICDYDIYNGCTLKCQLLSTDPQQQMLE